MKSFASEFKAFALRGNVLDLAIGVVIGTAFGAITGSLVSDIITPILGLVIGGINFSALALFMVMKGINTMKKKEAEHPTVKSAELTVLEEIRDSLKK